MQSPEENKMANNAPDEKSRQEADAAAEKSKQEAIAAAEKIAELEARLAASESEREQLREVATRSVVADARAATMGIVEVEPELVYVQVDKDFGWGGRGTGNPRVLRHREFNLAGGEIVRMPKALASELKDDYPDRFTIGDGFKDQVIGVVEFDKRTGAPRTAEKTIKVNTLKKNARKVGLPCVR